MLLVMTVLLVCKLNNVIPLLPFYEQAIYNARDDLCR